MGDSERGSFTPTALNMCLKDIYRMAAFERMHVHAICLQRSALPREMIASVPGAIFTFGVGSTRACGRPVAVLEDICGPERRVVHADEPEITSACFPSLHQFAVSAHRSIGLAGLRCAPCSDDRTESDYRVVNAGVKLVVLRAHVPRADGQRARVSATDRERHIV